MRALLFALLLLSSHVANAQEVYFLEDFEESLSERWILPQCCALWAYERFPNATDGSLSTVLVASNYSGSGRVDTELRFDELREQPLGIGSSISFRLWDPGPQIIEPGVVDPQNVTAFEVQLIPPNCKQPINGCVEGMLIDNDGFKWGSDDGFTIQGPPREPGWHLIEYRWTVDGMERYIDGELLSTQTAGLNWYVLRIEALRGFRIDDVLVTRESPVGKESTSWGRIKSKSAQQ